LVEHHPAVREVLHPGPGVRSALDWLRFGLGLRPRRFDAVLDLQYNWRTLGLKAALAPAKFRHWNSSNLSRRRRIRDHDAPPVEPMVARLQQASRPWAREGIAAPLIVGDSAARARAAGWLAARGPSDAEWLAVAPVAHWATKRWPAERYAMLAGRWAGSGRNRRVAAFFGPADAGVKAAFLEAAGGTDGIHAVEQPLGDAAEILRRASAMVAGDTGLMHLAAALGVRTLALFGPTSSDFGVAPFGPLHRSVSLDLECQPCSLHGQNACPLGHHRCLSELSVEHVWNELEIMRGGR
jgi:heptosyltransferase-2